MVRPSELLYQSLVPGISTITLRLRYYSFFPWLLDQYAKKIGHTDPARFRIFQRRAEALFALVGVTNGDESGVTGAKWARKARDSDEDPIDFVSAADPNSETRYLKNKTGAYGAIYSSQMREMGLVTWSSEHKIDLPSEAGEELANALGDRLGEAQGLFLNVVERGFVSRLELEQLTAFKPREIKPDTEEQRLLQELLLASSTGPEDRNRARHFSMIQLLKLADEMGGRPSPNDAKWAWYASSANPENPADPAQASDVSLAMWQLYHANDLLRLAYEGILKRGLDTLATSPGKAVRLPRLVDALIDQADLADTSWQSFVRSSLAEPDEQPEQEYSAWISQRGAPEKLTDEETLKASISLLAVIAARVEALQSSIDRWMLTGQHFQSLRTEQAVFSELENRPLKDALREIVENRILKRHLWVAARKLRNQRAYTYLAEVAEGRLRFRSSFTATLSNPRLEQSLTFLEDVGLLDKNGLTAAGHDVLGSS